jgi:hypothetical protein
MHCSLALVLGPLHSCGQEAVCSNVQLKSTAILIVMVVQTSMSQLHVLLMHLLRCRELSSAEDGYSAKHSSNSSVAKLHWAYPTGFYICHILCGSIVHRRELSSAEEGYSAKQRLVEGYGADRKEAEMRQLSEQLAELKDKRDACNRVRLGMC